MNYLSEQELFNQGGINNSLIQRCYVAEREKEDKALTAYDIFIAINARMPTIKTDIPTVVNILKELAIEGKIKSREESDKRLYYYPV